MKPRNPHPRLFCEVLEAIASLKEAKGSSTQQIMSQVESILSEKRKQLRNDINQIRRALKHGVDTGLIRFKSGKYKIDLDPDDYKVFRNFQRLLITDMPNREHKRKEGRRKKRRRSKVRRSKRRGHLNLERYATDDNYTGSSSDTTYSPRDSPTPEDKGRRRGRKRKNRRRSRSGGRRRRGRRHADRKDTEGKNRIPDNISMKNRKSSNDSMKSSEIRKSTSEHKSEEKEDRKIHEPRRDNQDESFDAESCRHCDNPGCLCNIVKSEDGNPNQ